VTHPRNASQQPTQQDRGEQISAHLVDCVRRIQHSAATSIHLRSAATPPSWMVLATQRATADALCMMRRMRGTAARPPSTLGCQPQLSHSRRATAQNCACLRVNTRCQTQNTAGALPAVRRGRASMLAVLDHRQLPRQFQRGQSKRASR
jgi:hypothetical protein